MSCRETRSSNTKVKHTKCKYALSAGDFASQNEDIDIYSGELSNEEEIEISIRTRSKDLNSAGKN